MYLSLIFLLSLTKKVIFGVSHIESINQKIHHVIKLQIH